MERNENKQNESAMKSVNKHWDFIQTCEAMGKKEFLLTKEVEVLFLRVLNLCKWD